MAIKMTPWQKVYAKFGLNGAELAKEIDRDRSKISRVLRSETGLINGGDQARLLAAAKRLGVELELSDLMPDV
jgi:hypothetical protein